MDSVAPSSTAPRALRGGALLQALRALAPGEAWSTPREETQHDPSPSVTPAPLELEPPTDPPADEGPCSEAPRALRPGELARWLQRH